MAQYNSFAYECSRNNASVKLDDAGTEWINEFSEGIHVDVGDQVRVLGSFVNEAATGQNIEITEDNNETNITFSPYIKGTTFATSDANEDLMKLGDYAEPAYSTDAFGIEPPTSVLYNTGNFPAPYPATGPYLTGCHDGAATIVGGGIFGTYFSRNTTEWYGDPHATGSGDTFLNSGDASGWRGQDQAANTWGTNIITSQNVADPTIHDKEHNYDRWKTLSIPNDFYISTMCKKLILPVFHQIRTGNGQADGRGYQNNFPFDDLIYDPPVTGAGMLSGVPKAGYFIATVDIGDTSGWYDDQGQSWNEVRDPAVAVPPAVPVSCPFFGRVNLKSGAQSVVGKLLAVRPIKHQTVDTYNTFISPAPPDLIHFDAFEVYVYDFFNPGLKNKILTTTGAIGEFQRASVPIDRTGAITMLEMNTTELNLRKQVHGATEFYDGYAYNPAFNHINGPVYQPQSGFEYDFVGATIPGNYMSGDGLPGCMAGRPTWNTMNKVDRSITVLTANGEAIYDVGSDQDAHIASQYDYGYGKDMGLSFLWSGSDCGLMRYPPYQDPLGGNLQQAIRLYKSNTISEMGVVGGNLTHGLRVLHRQVNVIDTNYNAMWNVGAMVICKPETMIAIINGEHDIVAGMPGTNPRYWFPWTYQIKDSNYNERHFINNGFNSDDGVAVATYASDPDVAASGISRHNDELRRDVGFVGIPLNQNWRSQYYAGRFCEETRGDQLAIYGIGAPIATPDMMPRYFSTQTGLFPTISPGNPASGGPHCWGGYNNSISSIYFQSPDNGDTDLCRTSHVVVVEIDYILNIGNVNIDFEDYPFATNEIEVNDRMFCNVDDAYGAWADVTTVVIIPGPSTGTRVTMNLANLVQLPVGTKYMFTNKGNYPSCGTEGLGWAGDMLCLKEYTMKIGVDTGFYAPSLLADKLNKLLHDNIEDYARSKGVYDATIHDFNIPSTVGLGEQNLASVPTIINSNMLQTFIPDISYGFTPITTENADRLEQTASTKDITSEILTYDSHNATLNTYTFYHWWDLPTAQITDNLKVYSVTTSNTDIGFTTPCGKHAKFYTVPYLDKIGHNKGDDTELHLFRLKGGALNSSDYNVAGTPPHWLNQANRFVGFETLREATFNGENQAYVPNPQSYFPDSQAAFWWKTRYVRNLFPNGGSCRVFTGANNPTMEFNEDENRIAITNLYTPFRPHQSENKSKTDFDVGDSIPSAIIDSRKNGTVTDSLCGVYINNLVGGAINEDNWGTSPMNNILYDTDSDATISTKGQGFCDKIGFSATYVATHNNDFDVVTTPYTFIDRKHIYGTTTRNLALIDSAVNATNPMVSNCLMIAPVRQYMVQVDSDEVFGDANPELGNDPFYLIGSDFPAKEFYGSTDGTKLPVIGICSRNFSSFNFVFDLGGSSITFTINEKKTIKSIRTKIFTSKMGTPNNLSKYSSVIYLITKGQWVNQLNPQQQQQSLEMIQANREAQLIGTFYNPSTASIRTEMPPYPVPKSYYESEGSIAEETETDTDDDL